jgi:hypothetical protein
MEMEYAIKTYDGELLSGRYATRAEAQKQLEFKRSNDAAYRLAYVVDVRDQ